MRGMVTVLCLILLTLAPAAGAEVLAVWEDPSGDDTGDGDYTYPTNLAFGEGDIDFDAVSVAIRELDRDVPLEVELSRHSATAPLTARQSLEFLRSLLA